MTTPATPDMTSRDALLALEQTAIEFAAALPMHKASLHLTHNQHLAYYQDVAVYLADCGDRADNWVSAEERAKAIATNEIWELQWYPDTPLGSHTFYAATLPALLCAASLRARANMENEDV